MVGLFLQGDSKSGFHGGRYGEDLREGIGMEGYGKGIRMGIMSGKATPVSISGRSESVVFMEEDEPKEWVAQVELGVLSFRRISQCRLGLQNDILRRLKRNNIELELKLTRLTRKTSDSQVFFHHLREVILSTRHQNWLHQMDHLM
ncbi:hypothetical protein SOVF_081460 [Spinacia oleracea]|nr:hypothetical protein SOVF_081460 [Spinacia oleracea]